MLVGQKIGPFQIEKELGSGAMGTVYKAKFDLKGKLVPTALKIVSLGLLGNESAMARFDREAKILKQLRHPHIVRLYGTGHYRQTPFIAMEYVDGESMDRMLARRGRMGWEEVFGYAKQLCEALDHAHEKGIIHRDLKPSNLMITKAGVLKLADFGIAKDTDVTALTAANSTIGTAAYMSPEQCRGARELTAKSDLYSLGVVLYELITGKKPFYAETTMDMFLKHVNDTAVRPRRLVPDLPVWVDNLIMFLLEKAPESRPLDAATVGRMLGDIEDKVQAQASAGLDVASARRVDRALTENELTDEDKEAARALKGKTKKAKKKKSKPFLEQVWWKATGLGLLLVGVLAVGVYFLWPESPEKTFAKVKTSYEETQLEELSRFFKEHGKSGSPVVEEAKALFVLRKTQQVEQALVKRYGTKDAKFNRLKASDGEEQEVLDSIWSAMDAEHAGNTKRANELWGSVRDKVPQPDAIDYTISTSAYVPAWRWVADKRVADIAAADKLLDPLLGSTGRIQRDRLGEEDRKYDPKDPEGQAVYALRLEEFGDKALARKTWATLADETKSDPDRHRWHLVAARKREEFPPAPEKGDTSLKTRRDLAVKWVADTQTQWADAQGKPEFELHSREVRIRCRELIDLYGDDPDETLRAQVELAKKLRGEATPR